MSGLSATGPKMVKRPAAPTDTSGEGGSPPGRRKDTDHGHDHISERRTGPNRWLLVGPPRPHGVRVRGSAPPLLPPLSIREHLLAAEHPRCLPARPLPTGTDRSLSVLSIIRLIGQQIRPVPVPPDERRSDMRRLTLLKGAAAQAGGFWEDNHGHRVFLCEGEVLPGCPRTPFTTTFWNLNSEAPCPKQPDPK
jgi:hypothetical protein